MKKQIVSALLIVCILMSLAVPAAAASALPFDDVPASAWYYEDLCYAYENALINGRSNTKFAPNEYMTYAEAVKLAACMHQMYTQGSVTLANATPWYAPYVEYCRANGIISKDYSWDSYATRAGYMEIFAAALPARALREINDIPVGAIPDVDKYHPQADAIYLLYRAGIVNGVDEAHACNPSSNIKRAEVAAILTRMMDSDARVSFSLGAGRNEYTPSVPVKPDEPDVPETPETPETPEEPEEPEEPEIPEEPEEPGEEELASVRQKALDYMRAMGEVVWSPAEKLDFTSISSGTMYAGTTYRGLPYVNTIDSSLEEFQGILEDGVYTGPTDIDEILGVDCSSSVLAAWSQIGASFNYVWTWQMMPFVEGGTIPVGEYKLPEEVTYGSTGTDDVIALNDQQTIYRAYAQLKPADAVINYTTSGHTRMVAEEPVIIYKSNGEISNASYVVTHEIWKNNHSDGELNTCWYLDRTYTFGELYKTSYLPVTCPELAAEEAAEVELTLTEENTVESLLTEVGLQGKLESNYRIFEVVAEIVGSNGTVVRRVVEYPINTISLQMASKTYNLEKLNDALYVEGLGADTYTLTLSAKVAGELQTVLTLEFSKENTLRDSVVAYLEAMASVEWTPDETLNFTSKELTYAKNQTYVGLPYVNQMDSTLEEFESYLVGGVYTGPTDFKTCIGVDGSAAVLAAWAMEASSFDYVYTKPMLPSYTGGTIPVGGYDTVNYVSDMDSAATTSEMIVRNGMNVMYQAYAQLQPADLIFYYYSSTGRASMVVETPVVVYGEDGTVDGAKSSVTTLEIDAAIYENEDGTQTSWKRKTYTFEELFEAFYVPVTCEELATGAQSKVQLALSGENTSDSIMESGLTGTLTSNYRMVSVKATIVDAAGGVVRTAEDFPLNTANLTMQSKQYDLEDLNAELKITELPAGDYKLCVEVLAGGEWLEVMNLSIGKLSELRQFVVDSITAMATVEWTPKVSFGKYKVGTTYYGMPWSNANVEPSLMEFEASLDANGVYQGSTSTSPMTVLGVDLISSISAVYEMIHPDINFTDSTKMIAALRAGNGGLVKVGEYDPAKSTAENGEQTMYQAYAQLQPADVVVGNSVYAFMVTSFPKVVYLEDGTINGEESYITVTQIDNSAQNKWFVNNKQYTFKSLYSGVINESRYCYPATCETLQTGIIPQATVNGPETVYENGGFVGTVTSNYRIYQVKAELCGSNGETVETLTVYPTNLDENSQVARSYDLSELEFTTLTIGESYTLKLSVFVANGWKEVGTYTFTK